MLILMPSWGIATLLAAAACAAAPAAARASDSGEPDQHDQARVLVEAGTIRPLTDILAGVLPALGGRVIDVALQSEGGRWIYELTVVGPDGRISEVDVDAATAMVVDHEGEGD